MKTCNNCLWRDVCDPVERCDFYEPVVGDENETIREYCESLRESAEEYINLIAEQEDVGGNTYQ